MKHLFMTSQDARTLRYLRWHIWRFGYAPTRKELAEAMSVSESGATRRIQKLAQMGHLEIMPFWRGIIVVGLNTV